MSTKLNDAVQEAIRANLTGQVAGELKDFIATAERNAAELERTKQQNERLQTQLDEANRKLSEHRSLDDKLNDISKREADLLEKQIQLRLDTAMNRALIAEAKLEGAMNVANLAFRNVEVQRSIHSSVPVPVEGMPGDPSRGIYPSPGIVQQHPATTTVTEQAK